jgi:hypothetical protein
MKLIEKIIRIEEYLNDWYDALPIPALHTLFYLETDELYTLSEADFEDRLFELKQEWEAMHVMQKILLHDRNEQEFSEFVSGVELKK